MYIHSFFLFIASLVVFIINIVLGAIGLESSVIDYTSLAISVLLALGAIRLLTLPPLAKWPTRTR